MSDKMILSLPNLAELIAAGGGSAVAAPAWALVRGGSVAARGTDDGWRALVSGDAAMPVIALVPAVDAPVRFWRYADLPTMQAATAGRLAVQRQILGAATDAHVVAAVPVMRGAEFAVATTSHGAMAAWRDWLGAQGVLDGQVAAMVPVAALMPPPDKAVLRPASDEAVLNAAPDAGVLLAVRWGAEAVMRGGDYGYAGDAAIDALFDGAPKWLSAAEWEAVLVQAAAQPVMDLRSGAWKKAASSAWNADLRRWAMGLTLGLVAVSLGLFAVQAGRLAADRDRADAAVMAAGQRLDIQAEDAAGVEAAMDRRLRERGGGASGFSVTASALVAALADLPSVSVTRMAHRGDGMLSASLSMASAADSEAIVRGLRAKGYEVTVQMATGSDGQPAAHIMMKAVP